MARIVGACKGRARTTNARRVALVRQGPMEMSPRRRFSKAGNVAQTHAEPMNLDKQTPKFLTLADELLLMIFAELDTKDLWAICRAFPEVQGILSSYDFIRVRELQCFCLKKGFLKTKLGVGVSILHTRKEGSFASEFDFLSKEAFDNHKVRRSIQGCPLSIGCRCLYQDDTGVW